MRLLARTDWLYDPGSSPLPRIHGPTCECRPETANLVPLLRALHAVIDRECESPIQKWLTRRRMMTERELVSAYGSFAPSGAILKSSDGRVFVDESALLMESARPTITRPGVLSPMMGCQPWGVLGSTAPEHTQRRLVVIDPVLCGRNAAFVKPLDVVEIDSDEEYIAPGLRNHSALSVDSMPSALSCAPTIRPELSIDAACEELYAAAALKRGSQVNVSERVLRKAIRRLVESGTIIAPQLAEKRSRGIISMLTAMLAVLPPKSPFRGWFCSIINSFLRAAPLPVRKWLAAHGIVPVLAGFLIKASTDMLADKTTPASSSALVSVLPTAAHASVMSSPLATPVLVSASVAPVEAAGASAPKDGDDACDSDEDSPAYERQSCFDVLSECVRGNMDAVDELWRADLQASAAKSLDTPMEVLRSSLLLRLACDFLSDSNMFLRALFSCEDWCYGLVSVLPSLGYSLSQGGSVRAGVTLDEQAPQSDESADSWERLADESIELVRCSVGSPISPLPTSPLYEHIDRVGLERPLLQFVRLFRIPLMYALMSAVTVDSICHDNICNVNTALLVFVAAHRHGALPALVSKIRKHHALVIASAAVNSTGIPITTKPALLPSLQRVENSASKLLSPAPPDVLLNFVHMLLFWLEYNSLRERDRRTLRSMAQYQYSEVRIVVRGLLGLPVTRARTLPLVALSALSEPPQSFYGIRQYVLERVGQGSAADCHIAAAGAASVERLRKTCAEFEAFAKDAHAVSGDSTQPSEGWLEAPPRLVAALEPATNTRVHEAYWEACSLLPQALLPGNKTAQPTSSLHEN
jgi:hypothetical protein